MQKNKIMRVISFFIFLLFSVSVFGQRYGNVWQFGDHAGIDFNSCDPINISTGSNDGFEGCSSICNAKGQLLFYTNSDYVWNRQNTEMPNGFLTDDGGTLSQVIIIPKPLSDSVFYIVTTEIQNLQRSLQYHVVDMNLNSGLGDVVSKNNSLTTFNITEQVAATYHSNGTDIWLLVHEYGTNRFFAYLVTQSGISSTPEISSVGPAQDSCYSYINARGEIKFSPDGHKVAFNGNGVGNDNLSNLLSLFDFDNSTGIVSNPIDLPFSGGDFGLSFSPDNSKLYGATWKAVFFSPDEFNYLYQFDLSSGNPSTIINSKVILDSVPMSQNYGSLKIGPNGKIYVARANTNYLGVINFPDQVGLACDYDSTGFNLEGKTCNFGLNNYIEYTNYCDNTSVSDLKKNVNEPILFPNPLIGSSLLQFDNSTKEVCTLTLYNVFGQLVRTISEVKDDKIIIEREDLTSGLYLFRIDAGKRTIAKGKLMIE